MNSPSWSQRHRSIRIVVLVSFPNILPPPVIVLELNEVTFPYLESYLRSDPDCLPAFRRLFAERGYLRTQSEATYENIEPWIQWVTAHTGKTFQEHGVFRLGDAVGKGLTQIYEVLESRGVSVGAVSPMNAENRCAHPAFFVPDPWTQTRVVAPGFAKRLYLAIRSAVEENASGKLRLSDFPILVLAALRYSASVHFYEYLKHGFRGIFRRWHRVCFLDLLISDLYFSLWKKGRPQFSTLFLNGAAHIQHHYLYNAKPCKRPQANPSWYVENHLDPLFEIYSLYDSILSRAVNLGARVSVVTGLSQEPYPTPVYYWRLADHQKFLSTVGVRFDKVETRMSRDFLVQFANEHEAIEGCRKLGELRDHVGEKLFEVDNRGSSAFVTLSYSKNITESTCPVLYGHTVFVALKNGHHTNVGYFIPLAREKNASSLSVPLSSIYHYFLNEAVPSVSH